jgi:hypothetical protein
MTPRVASALVALTVVLLWPLAVQAGARELVITDQDNGRTFTVQVGQKIMVNLRHPGGRRL